jgi:hypothetical protein
VWIALRQAEIENLGAVGGELNVRRFEITMHDPTGVRRCERASNLPAESQRIVEWQNRCAQTVGERLALQISSTSASTIADRSW